MMVYKVKLRDYYFPFTGNSISLFFSNEKAGIIAIETDMLKCA